jgi:hypothetical protein
MAELLPIPVAAQRDPRAVNMASLWIAEGSLHCSIRIGIYEGRPDVNETQAWGTILADLARNVADALISDGSAPGPRQDVINRIWNAFHEELSRPGSAPQ